MNASQIAAIVTAIPMAARHVVANELRGMAGEILGRLDNAAAEGKPVNPYDIAWWCVQRADQIEGL